MISVFHRYHRHLAIAVSLSLSTAVVTAISFTLVNECFQYFSASPMNLEDHLLAPNPQRGPRVPHSNFRIGRRSLILFLLSTLDLKN